uniref:Uncharacterized protein n=1 Tax=Arundo donax TaxID=35708 RepID=A0A0A8YLG7_ARUDO
MSSAMARQEESQPLSFVHTISAKVRDTGTPSWHHQQLAQKQLLSLQAKHETTLKSAHQAGKQVKPQNGMEPIASEASHLCESNCACDFLNS